VVITRNEGDWLRETIKNLADTLPGDSEIVVVDDGSEDGSADFLEKEHGVRLLRTTGIGVAKARNLGGRASSGDIVIFCDAHLKLPANWWRPMVEVLCDPKSGAVAPAVAGTRQPDFFRYGLTLPNADLEPKWLDYSGGDPFHAPVLPGCCFAMRRSVFEETGGFDEGLRARGRIDAETSLRLWLLGYENWIAPEAKVWHYFRRCAPFTVGADEVLHNRLRTAMAHLRPDRVAAVVRAYADDPVLGHALLLTAAGGVAERRTELWARRVRDDDWYFEKFRIEWKPLRKGGSADADATEVLRRRVGRD
jgi:GT2 family glycosyltransferase